ncbi:MAG TPA: choice-of-anchor J domain-containing protein [Flavobacteriales bacterium]|nr:choice-of-anchor J domain-containing protein [Flavobacteriales bacterium]HRO40471.1 choice-of-anchor J domain-containing protein [Flavobacteriales bacterium]HRP81250.1 choice-of-anchor J domain-containing protein [Flavobacteriales bacterium]
MMKHLLLPALCTLPLLGFSQLNENFDDITTLDAAGWTITNVSNPVGTASWFQGNPTALTSYNGADNSYIGVNFNSTSGAGDISNWLITPVVMVQDGDQASFWTSTTTGSQWNDRLEVRASVGSATLPAGPTDVGSFNLLLTTINDGMDLSYPEVWTQYAMTISGVGSTPVPVRVAFRYNVLDGGPSGTDSNYIGIDAVQVGTPVGVSELATADFEFYPNPMANVLNIRSTQRIKTVAAYNMVGQEVTASTSVQGNQINVSALAEGVYMFRITLANGLVKTIKVTKA